MRYVSTLTTSLAIMLDAGIDESIWRLLSELPIALWCALAGIDDSLFEKGI